jgi:Cu/Ag efflux pump CusA|tara:strand:- start:199 stop:369 length:171 start_codon:yes stop_codon:yes gene_type:complete
MKIDLKIIITIGSLLVPLVGFYYTTNMRLDALEASITSVQKQIKQIKKTKKGKNKK